MNILSVNNLKLLFCFLVSAITTYVVYIFTDNSSYAAIAVLFWLFMALNIGANDVANNLSASIWARAMNIKTGIIIAIIFEFAWAMIAWGDVTSTIKKGIIDPAMIESSLTFIWIMISALFWAALWLTIATRFGYPVSTTHSIVGWIMGSGIMSKIVWWGTFAAWLSMVDWPTMWKIAFSWLASPVLWALFAYIMFSVIRKYIVHVDDRIKAAKRYVPILISLMAFIFITYLILKGLKKVWGDITWIINSLLPFLELASKPSLTSALIISLILSIWLYVFIRPIIAKKADKIDPKLNEDDMETEVNKLFIIPIIASAAALCFAHGSNDVANAIWPLAAVIDSINLEE